MNTGEKVSIEVVQLKETLYYGNNVLDLRNYNAQILWMKEKYS